LKEIRGIGAAGVFGVKFDVIRVIAGELDGIGGHLQHGRPLLLQGLTVALVAKLSSDMDIRDADPGVDARPPGFGQRSPASLDVGGHRPRKGAYDRALNFLRDQLHGLEVFR